MLLAQGGIFTFRLSPQKSPHNATKDEKQEVRRRRVAFFPGQRQRNGTLTEKGEQTVSRKRVRAHDAVSKAARRPLKDTQRANAASLGGYSLRTTRVRFAREAAMRLRSLTSSMTSG